MSWFHNVTILTELYFENLPFIKKSMVGWTKVSAISNFELTDSYRNNMVCRLAFILVKLSMTAILTI